MREDTTGFCEGVIGRGVSYKKCKENVFGHIGGLSLCKLHYQMMKNRLLNDSQEGIGVPYFVDPKIVLDKS